MTQVEEARRNARFLALLEELFETPDRERLKPAYSAKLLALRELTTEELYVTIVQVYEL